MTTHSHYVVMYQQVHKMRLKAKKQGDDVLREQCNQMLLHLKGEAKKHLAKALNLVPTT